MNRKSILFGLLALLAMLSISFDAYARPPVREAVQIVGQDYDRETGDFTIYVEANCPWVVWYSPAIGLPFTKVSKVQGAGKDSWTDYGAGLRSPMGFYIAVPKGKEPLPGNRWGWYRIEQNPHWPVAVE